MSPGLPSYRSLPVKNVYPAHEQVFLLGYAPVDLRGGCDRQPAPDIFLGKSCLLTILVMIVFREGGAFQ